MNEINPELLKRYFSGLCSADEKAVVVEWFASQKPDTDRDGVPLENAPVFEGIDKEVLKTSIWSKLNTDTAPQSQIKVFALKPIFRYLVAAASVTLLLLTGYWLYLSKQVNQVATVSPAVKFHQTHTRPGERIRVALPDGSVAYINSDSQLRFPYQFASDARTLYLEGEAFFEVVKDSLRPFTVITPQDTRVQVLGTSFNVQAYEQNDNAVTVSVRTGKVRVIDKKGSLVLLTSNQAATTFTSGENILTQYIQTDKNWAWKDNRLVFEDEQLSNLILTLEKWYGVQIEIKNKDLSTRRFTGDYHNPSISNLLNDMGKVLLFSYKAEKGKVTIY